MPGIDAARARGHHEPLKRGEPHRRVDRRPVADRAQRGAGAEMATDDADVRATDQRRRPPRDPRVGQAVKPVAPEPPALAPGRGQRVGDRGRRQRRVKRGVEAGDGGQVGQRVRDGVRARRATSAGAAARDRSARSSSSTTPAIEAHGVAEPLAAVDDPVADRVGRTEPIVVERPSQRVRVNARLRRGELALAEERVVGVEQPQLDRARPGVDDEHSHDGDALLRRRVRHPPDRSAPARRRATSSRAPPGGRRRTRACRRGRAGARRPSPGAAARAARRARALGRSRRSRGDSDRGR